MRFFLLILTFLIGCAKPRQPALSVKEQSFFQELRREGFEAHRDIDVMLLGRYYKKGYQGSYGLDLKMNCEALLALDSLKAKYVSDSLVAYLYSKVLLRDSKFNRIYLSFVCDTNESSYQSKVFEYYLDSIR